MRTRFAPSPTGRLHLGHAFSALTAWELARAAGGEFLLRIEDTDPPRARPEYEAAIYDDLAWLGLSWPEPVLRQSEHLPRYAAALDRLTAMGLTYPCRCTRADIRAALSAPQEGAPARGPVYPGTCRGRSMDAGRAAPPSASTSAARSSSSATSARSPSTETGPGPAGTHRARRRRCCAPGSATWCSARKDIGAAAYHLAVVVDDAHQGITHVVRGEDLWEATPLHRLLQALLGLPVPVWHHHRLIRDAAGRRLAKRDDARALAALRADGATPADIRHMLGFRPEVPLRRAACIRTTRSIWRRPAKPRPRHFDESKYSARGDAPGARQNTRHESGTAPSERRPRALAPGFHTALKPGEQSPRASTRAANAKACAHLRARFGGKGRRPAQPVPLRRAKSPGRGPSVKRARA